MFTNDLTILDIKHEFFKFRDILSGIKKKEKELAIITSKLDTPQSAKLSDIPPGGANNDRILFLIQEKLNIEEELKNLIKKRDDSQTFLSQILSELSSESTADELDRKLETLILESSILKLRYLCGFSWNEINKAFYSENDDFSKCEEVYLKKVFRAHGRAFVDLEKMLIGVKNA